MILGDFNAQVGANSSAWPDILGSHGYGNMNDNGQRLQELCSTHKLCVPSSFFQGSRSSKVTWRHPRSKRWHQLDHVLVKREHLKEVTHCRSLHSADCDTDHTLLRCKLRMVPSKFHYARPKPTPRLDVSATYAPAYLLPALNLHLLMRTSQLPGSTSTLLPQRPHSTSLESDLDHSLTGSKPMPACSYLQLTRFVFSQTVLSAA